MDSMKQLTAVEKRVISVLKRGGYGKMFPAGMSVRDKESVIHALKAKGILDSDGRLVEKNPRATPLNN